jgi:glycerophosphoryl diester phosphodiesterase
VIAHRGASAGELENTLPAFRRARDEGADAVELDVMRCGSGEVVVFHDDDLQRLFSQSGETRTLPWRVLEALGIPLLSQVLDELGPLAVNVELKSHPDWRRRLVDDGLAAEVAKVIAGHEDKVIVSSFDPLLLRRFRTAAPDVATGLLFAHDQSRPLRDAWAAQLLQPTALHPESLLVDQIAVEGWRARGYLVNVWTVDDPAELRWLAALGVDGVITNRPAASRKALNSVIAS